MLLRMENILPNTFAIYAASAVILLTTLYYILRHRGLPPGPIGLPFFGYLPFFNADTLHLQLQKLGKKYGNVFSFGTTGRVYINLGSAKALREALITKQDCFQNRNEEPNMFYQQLNGGILFLSGEPWKILRKFFLQQFRERGMTAIKDEFSGPIYDTVRQTINDLAKEKGKPVDIASILTVKCSAIMRHTLFGTDGMTDEELKEFNHHYQNMLKVLTATSLLPTGFITKYFILPYYKGMKEAMKGTEEAQHLLLKVIERRRASFNEGHIRDLVDAFIKEANIRRSKNDPMAKYFTDRILAISLIQIVGDGIVFLALFIGVFLKALLDHPEEQEKIYKELIEVVGVNRDPGIEDKSKLSYTNAFISEVLRTTDVITIFPTLECAKETTISGYRIPKGAILLYNFWMAHMNPEDYKEPEKFKPSRFIVKDGSKKPEPPVSFGMGKRACMGEGFAMTQVFLFLTTIIKNFHLRKPSDIEDKTSLFYVSQDLYICAHPRTLN